MISAGLRAGSSLALRTVAALALLVALFGDRLWPLRRMPEPTVLLDVSASMPADAVELRWQDLLRSLQQAGAPAPRVISFGRDLEVAPSGHAVDFAGLRDATDRSGTNLAAALDAAIAPYSPDRPAAVIAISDAHATSGDTEAALRAAQAAQLPVYWIPIGRAATTPGLGSVTAPTSARVHERVPLGIRVHAPQAGPVAIEAGFDADLAMHVSRRLQAGENELTLEIPAEHSGLREVFVQLVDDSSGETLDERRPAAVVDVQGLPEILYVADTETPLLASLRGGGWPIEWLSSAQLPGAAARLARFHGIILDDVPIDSPDATVWQALEAAVREHGVGLAVLGGPHSFGRGGYRGSRLEGLLPVASGPGDRAPGATIVFAIDKSGSMGSAARGVDRLSQAREAVLATLRTLGPRDRAAVVAFDVAAQVTVPPGPVDAAIRRLENGWEISPSGGTRLAPALRAAEQLLAGSPTRRRMLVLVTDGFLADESLQESLGALRAARVELVALAIGSDARVAQAARLLQPLGGEVLRLAETAELPRLMPARVNARRSAVVHGPLAVRAVARLPFPFATASWPPVDAYAMTHARSASAVSLESAAGDPILASHLAGLGRVVALPAGLGAWTPAWIGSKDWPGIAGAVAAWVGSSEVEAELAIRARDAPGKMIVEVDVAHGGTWQSGTPPRLTVVDPLGRRSEARLSRGGPGRFVASLSATESGIYRVAAVSGTALRQHAHLRREPGEADGRGVNPRLDRWRERGWIRPWPAGGAAALARPLEAQASGLSVTRPVWLAVALMAFLAAVLVDCRGVLTTIGADVLPKLVRRVRSGIAAWVRLRGRSPLQRVAAP